MAKKKSKDYDNIWKEFQSDLTNGELQNNYNEFKDKVNDLIPQHEDAFIHHQKIF